MLMLLQVDKQNGKLVSGVHIQWVSEGFQRAVELARGTEQVNGNRFSVAVVEALYDSYATGRYYIDLERLDVPIPDECALAETKEYNAIFYFLDAVKIDDMEISFEDGIICAVDSDENKWIGKEFYEFLLNEVVMLRPDMTLVDGFYMKPEILADVVALAQKYGAEIYTAEN